MRCAVFGCKSDNQVKGFKKDISFHVFPKDDIYQKNWVNACRRKDRFNVKTARMCSKHFDKDYY